MITSNINMGSLPNTYKKSTTQLNITESISPDGIPYVTVRGVYPFDAALTFGCGQCFRFDPRENAYPELYGDFTAWGGVAYGRYINVISRDLDTVIIEGATEDDFYTIWYRYFGFDVDYAGIMSAIREYFGDGHRMTLASLAGCGIRILRQEPWEALCSFIISQNNNIPRIKKIISDLCLRLGQPVSHRGHEYGTFPTHAAIYKAGNDGLAPSKMGFRAKYVLDAARRIATGETSLDDIERAVEAGGDAASILMKIKGVGPKVATCALLYGFGDLSQFPSDVWIKRTAGKYFDDIAKLGKLSPYAGVLQQYIYHFERNIASAGYITT